MKRILSLLIVLVLLFTVGCGAKSARSGGASESQKGNYSDGVAPKPNTVAPSAPPILADNGSKGAEGAAADTAKYTEQDKKIIKNYDISLVVEDLKKFTKDTEEKAKSLGGYIQNEETGEMTARVIVRIPAAGSDSFIDYIDKGYEVKTKNSRADDITQSYVDNEARLNNLKAQEAQFLEILKKANSVEEILKVQNEVFRVRGEIESLEARKKTWDRLIEYATISIYATKTELVKEQGITIIKGNDFFNAIGKGIKNSAVFFVYAMQKIVIFLIGNIIWIGILVAAGVVGYRKYVKGKIRFRDDEKK